jgi:two-component system nitrate/nitrite sensor histidine kinase NarX
MKNSARSLANSVIFQMLMALLLIAGMALASMSLSVYVTMSAQDDAEAINLAGSLRMQSYRIGHILARAETGEIADPAALIAEENQRFSNKLLNSSISDSVLESGNTPLNQSYRQVVINWQDHMEPLLVKAAAPGASWADISGEYSLYVGEYVDAIDYMVTHLQRNTEGKIELLGMTEGVSIILTIFIVLFFVMKADANFAVPLRRLVLAAQRVEKGDLTHRIEQDTENELGMLSHTFNNMIRSLETQYRTLEEQVDSRTDELRKSNQALHFLYKTSREISSSPHDRQLLSVFLTELKKVADVDLVNLCISAEPNYVDYQLIATQREGLDSCIGDCGQCALAPDRLPSAGHRDISLPIRNRDDLYGFLYVRTGSADSLNPWQNQLLTTVAETLSTAFAFHSTLGRERRLILLEERSAIARELHDSLAQSISYMKLETARLRKMLDRGFEQERISEAFADLQEGLNAAYRHLRELLVTFRVKLDAPNLHAALDHAIGEFEEQTSAELELRYNLGSFAQRPNDDIHVLQILREALNNAIKHSGADKILVECYLDDNKGVIFAVEDNGVGMPDNPEKEHHYGLHTMRERAQQMNGDLSFLQSASGGTRVELHIAPDSTPLPAYYA